MYFIIEGNAVVLVPNDEEKVFVMLKKTDYFGEIAIITGKS